jgi:hypothetical protein
MRFCFWLMSPATFLLTTQEQLSAFLMILKSLGPRSHQVSRLSSTTQSQIQAAP